MAALSIRENGMRAHNQRTGIRNPRLEDSFGGFE
jgi:hypothetical protein